MGRLGPFKTEKTYDEKNILNLRREWGKEKKEEFIKYIKDKFNSKYSEEEALHLFAVYRSIDVGDEENALICMYDACRFGNTATIKASTNKAESAESEDKANVGNLYSSVLKEKLSSYLSPLHFAAERGLYKVVGKLIEDGANLEMRDDNENKPLYLAVQKNHPEVVELLVSKKNVDDTMPHENENLLSYAVKYGYDQVMIILINTGANLTQLNSKTKIPSSVLKESLDNCIHWEEEETGEKYERMLVFNYENILHPKNHYSDSNVETPNQSRNNNESKQIKNILLSSSCRSELLTHPTIKAFIFMKWKKIEVLFVVWILLKFAFFLFLLMMCINLQFNPNTTPYQTDTTTPTTPKMTFTTNSTTPNLKTTTTSTTTNIEKTTISSMATVDNISVTQTMSDGSGYLVCDHLENENRIFKTYDTNWAFVCIFCIIFFLSEVFQIINAVIQRTKMNYFTEFKNFLQWVIIVCLLILLSPTACGQLSHRHTIGVLLPMACYELLHEIGYLPGCAHIIEIFKIVSGTFLTYLSFYSLLIISFSASFFIMLPKATEEYPSSFGPLFVKYIVMFTGEQDFMKIPFSNSYRSWEMAFYVVFLLLVSVVLMNVLNALAVRDMHEMMNEAEIPMLNQLFKTIQLYDGLHSKLTGDRNILQESKLKFTPFKEETRRFYSDLKRWPVVKQMKKLFFYTFEVVDAECIHGHHGAIQIISQTEETRRMKKDKEMLRIEKSKRELNYRLEEKVRANQIDAMLNLIEESNFKMNTICSSLKKLENSECHASHHVERQPHTDMDEDRAKTTLDDGFCSLIKKTTQELLKTDPDLLRVVITETVATEFEQIFLSTLRNFHKSENIKKEFDRQHSRVPAMMPMN